MTTDRSAAAELEVDVSEAALDTRSDEIDAAPIRAARLASEADMLRVRALSQQLSIDGNKRSGSEVDRGAGLDGKDQASGNRHGPGNQIRSTRSGPGGTRRQGPAHRRASAGIIPDVEIRASNLDVVLANGLNENTINAGLQRHATDAPDALPGGPCGETAVNLDETSIDHIG